MPRRLGKYEILARLAKGGMAEIFLARLHGAMGFTRLVVVKCIRQHFAEEESFVRMFLAEAKVAAMIHHPNVVQILDFGESEGHYYLAMELIKGPSVASILRRALRRRRPLPWKISAEIVVQACDGLHAAHELCDASGHHLGLVHRDVSPSNLMVSDSGVVKLVDFGIAKAEEVSQVKTRTGMVKGKYPYLAPEMCRGEPLDRRADVFSLGTTFHEMVTGTRVFERENALATLKAIADDPIVDPSTVRPDLPSAVAQIILRAMSRDPNERFTTAAKMGSALRREQRLLGAQTSARQLARYLHDEHASLLERRDVAIRQVVQRAEERTGEQVISVSGFDDAGGGAPEGTTGPLPPRRMLGRRRLLLLAILGALALALAGGILYRRLAPPPPPLRFAFVPTFTKKQVASELEPFLDYLQQRLGRPVRIVVDLDYESMRRQLIQGQLDLAALPHLQMLLAMRQSPRPRMVAATSYKGSTTYRSVLVTRDNSVIQNVADLKGMRICWGDRGSASGFLMPRHLLRGEGIDPDRMVLSRHSNSHFAALKDLLEERCDAAATNEGWLVRATKEGLATSRLRVLTVAGNIPLDVICASARFPAELVQKTRRALLEFSAQRDIGRDQLGPSFLVDGFAEPSEKDFKAFERAALEEGILR